jgi:hypothetical protein
MQRAIDRRGDTDQFATLGAMPAPAQIGDKQDGSRRPED